MQEYITTVSKYLLVLCMAFYTLDSLMVFRYRNDREGGFIYLRQNFWMFAIQFVSFFNIAILSRDWFYVWCVTGLFVSGIMYNAYRI